MATPQRSESGALARLLEAAVAIVQRQAPLHEVFDGIVAARAAACSGATVGVLLLDRGHLVPRAGDLDPRVIEALRRDDGHADLCATCLRYGGLAVALDLAADPLGRRLE